HLARTQDGQRLEQVGAGRGTGHGHAQGLQHLPGLEALGRHGVVEDTFEYLGVGAGLRVGGQGGGVGREGGAHLRVPLFGDYLLVVAAAHGGLAGFGIGAAPLQRKHREAEAVAVALAELARAIGLEQQRQVGKVRHRFLPAQIPVQQHVQRRGGQPLLAPNDVGDVHQVVVHDVGQVVGRHAIRLHQHLVIDGARMHHDPAANQI
nr:hypothetical protein [Tanacetum cinerariifolium]